MPQNIIGHLVGFSCILSKLMKVFNMFVMYFWKKNHVALSFLGISNENGKFTTEKRGVREKRVSTEKISASVW